MRTTAIAVLLATGLLAQTPPASSPQKAPPVADVPNYVAKMVTAPPKELGLDPFYTKYADAFGIPIVGSDQVEADAVLMARDIVNYMLIKRADVRAELIRRGSRIMIIAHEEGQMDLPEYRDWKKPAKTDPRLTQGERDRYDLPGGIASMTDAGYWNNRARGMGGIRTSCAEENLLGYANTKYWGEHICVHEFSHGIMSALRTVDPGLIKELEAAYAAAKEMGLYKKHYAENTIAEYWAEGTQWWFWSNFSWPTENKTELWSPDSLKEYDPTLYDILSRVYLDHHIPADIYYARKVKRGPGSPVLGPASR